MNLMLRREALISMANYLKKISGEIFLIRENLKKESANLEWKISLKNQIDEEILKSIHKLDQLIELTNNMSRFIYSTISIYDEVDNKMAAKLIKSVENINKVFNETEFLNNNLSINKQEFKEGLSYKEVSKDELDRIRNLILTNEKL
jgi:hypothetical protein